MSIEIFKKMKLFVSGYSVSAHRYREDTQNLCNRLLYKTVNNGGYSQLSLPQLPSSSVAFTSAIVADAAFG